SVAAGDYTLTPAGAVQQVRHFGGISNLQLVEGEVIVAEEKAPQQFARWVHFALEQPPQAGVRLRTDAEAKSAIVALLNYQPGLDYSGIARALTLRLRKAVQ